MEEEGEALSSSKHEDSSDEFLMEPEDDIGCVSNSDDDDDDTRNLESQAGTSSPDEDRKSQNVDALVRGSLIVKRQSLLPRVYSVTDAAANLRKPFKPPSSNGYSSNNELLARRLCARKRFVPWGSTSPTLIAITNRLKAPEAAEIDAVEDNVELPPGIEPLVLWQPEEIVEEGYNLVPIIVDPLLVRFLRPHQREGVQFTFDCVSGALSSFNINGCILADDMGLGKTLQSITLLYTLLRQGFDGKPMVRKAIIVTPTSLVSNWEAEINKWVGERVKLVALCESTRDDVVSGIESFINTCSNIQVLIVSYETFRMHSSKFSNSGSCDLLICDEAHRLKNDQTLTNRALAALACKRRVLLSGTPMQNDLEEFYAMVNFTNPGILGDAAHFRRYFETPIICGREPIATEEEKKLGSDRSAELSSKVNQFILRRTNALLSNHLPPKIIEVVCCKLTPLQSELYNHFIHSKNVKRAIAEEGKQSKVLAYITALKKLCNQLHSAIIHYLTRERLYLDARCLIKRLIENLRKNSNPRKVCSLIFNDLGKIDSGSSCNVFGVLIIALSEMGFVDDAYWVYQKMVNLPPLHACNALLDGYVKMGKFEFMWDIYRNMLSFGLCPSVVTYGVVIDACCLEGEILKAKMLYDEMAEKGIQPNVVIYTTLIRGICSENKIQEAQSMFNKMWEIGVMPNLFTYNTLMDGFSKMADTGRAFQLYQEMVNHGILPNVVTFGILIDMVCKAGEVIAARNLFAFMVKFGVSPNLFVYNCLIGGCCNSYDMSTALEMHSEMKKLGISPDVVTYGTLIKGYCTLGKVDEAENFLLKMDAAVVIVNSVVYNQLIDRYCKDGNMEKALALCSQMIEKGVQPDVVTFSILIDGFGKAGDVDAAMGVFTEMIIKGLKPDVVAYTALIDAHFKKGNTNAALRLHKEMMEAGVAPNSLTFTCLVDGFLKNGMIGDAIKFFLKISSSGSTGVKVDCCSGVLSFPNNVTYSSLIHGLCKDGQYFKAYKFFVDLRRNGLYPDLPTYAMMIQRHFEARHITRVMMLKADMLKTGFMPHPFMYKVLLKGYQDMVDLSSTRKCYEELKDSGLFFRSISNAEPTKSCNGSALLA